MLFCQPVVLSVLCYFLVFQEPEWDVSSAFVAKVASHIKLKTPKSRTTQFSRENKENEARGSQVHTQQDDLLSVEMYWYVWWQLVKSALITLKKLSAVIADGEHRRNEEERGVSHRWIIYLLLFR